LAAQAKAIRADFFHIDNVFMHRPYVLFFIEHGTRRVYLARITDHPVVRGSPIKLWVPKTCATWADACSGHRRLGRVSGT
jgi:hypothetical protein